MSGRSPFSLHCGLSYAVASRCPLPGQTYQPALEEVPGRHFLPAVIVGIADDKAREHEEEVHSQVAVVDRLVGPAVIVGLEQMVGHYEHGCYTAQSVKDLIAGF